MILAFYCFDMPMRGYIIPSIQCLDAHRLKTKDQFKFMTSYKPISFSRRTMYHGVSKYCINAISNSYISECVEGIT